MSPSIPELCQAVRCELIDMLQALRTAVRECDASLFSPEGRETRDHCERIIALLRQIERTAKEKEAADEKATAD